MEVVAAYNFGGTHTLSIDDKGRLTVPSSFRKDLGEEIVVRKNPQERCVEILPTDVWNLYLAELRKLPKLDRKAQAFITLETAGAVHTTIDKQGRVLMPADMKQLAGLGAGSGQAVVTGCIDRVKVWSLERWNDLQSEHAEEDLAAYVYAQYNI